MNTRQYKDLEKRVDKGIAWLQKNASQGWELNFVHFTDTRWDVYLDMRYDTLCPLAVAFSDQYRFVRTDGRVSEATVIHGMGIGETYAQLGFGSYNSLEIPVLEEIWKSKIRDRIIARKMPLQFPRKPVAANSTQPQPVA